MHPYIESAEFHWSLVDARVPSRFLLYLKESHSGFVLDWWPRARQPRQEQGGTTLAWWPGRGKGGEPDDDDALEGKGLSPYTRDILRVLKSY